MKLIVCIKQIQHTYVRTGRNPDTYFIEKGDSINRINPYDEAAFLLAHQLRQWLPAGEIVLLTLGSMTAEREIRRLMALGANRLVRLDSGNVEKLDTWQKSLVLAEAIQLLRGDVVFCGKESLDSGNGLMGGYLSHHLNLPFLSGIHQLKTDKNNLQFLFYRKAGKGKQQVWRCRFPAVISVDQTIQVPNPPSLKNRYEALSIPIETLYLQPDQSQSMMGVKRVFPPRPKAKMIPSPDSRLPAFDRINALLSGSHVQKNSVMMTGSVDSQVDAIVSFFEEAGLISAEKPTGI